MSSDALALAAAGQYKKALKLFLNQKAFRNAALCYNNLGNKQLNEKKYQKALTLYTKALKLGKINHIVLDNIGTTYRESGNPGKAVKFYENALRISPNYNLAKINLEFVLMQLCDWNKIRNYKTLFVGTAKTPFLSIITADSPSYNYKTAKTWQR